MDRRTKLLLAASILPAVFFGCSGQFTAADSAADGGGDATGDGAVDATGDAVVGTDGATCARDCQGGACVAGVCQPVVLARGLNGPYGIALRGSALYVTELVAHGRVLRLDKSGMNQTPTVLATEAQLAQLVNSPTYLAKPFAITANDHDIFWSDVGGLASPGFTKIFRLPTAQGGVVVPYYEICAQAEVAVNDLTVVWANQATPGCSNPPEQNGLFRRELNGTISGKVTYSIGADGGAQQISPFAVGLTSDLVFVGAGNQLFIYGLAQLNDALGPSHAPSGSSTVLTAAPYAIASDFANVVFTDYQPSGRVYSLPKNAGPNTAPLLLAKSQDGPLGITTDDTGAYVYFTNYGAGTLMRVTKDGLGTPEVVLSNLLHPSFLTSDATTLFFTVFGTGQADGMVMRVAKP